MFSISTWRSISHPALTLAGALLQKRQPPCSLGARNLQFSINHHGCIQFENIFHKYVCEMEVFCLFFCWQENKIRMGAIFSPELAEQTKETRLSFEQTGRKNIHSIQFSSLVNKQTNKALPHNRKKCTFQWVSRKITKNSKQWWFLVLNN